MRTWMALIGAGLISLASCSSLEKKADSDSKTKPQWSDVRGRLKFQLAVDSFRRGQLKAAAEHVKESIGLAPDSIEPYILSAKILLERGEIASANEALEQAQVNGAESGEWNYFKGVIAQRYASFEQALAYYREASKLEPMNAHYVVAVAEMLVALNQPAEALALACQRWTDFEQNATLRALAGEIHMMFGRYEQAANAYREAARISPDDLMLKCQLGLALTRAEHFEEARDILAAVSSDSGDVAASILLSLGRCHLKLGQYAQAKDVFRRTVKLAPNNPRSHGWLAQAALACDDLLTARRSAMQAEQLNPENVHYVMLLGFICWKQHDFASAVDALEKVIEHSPSDPMALYLLNQSYQSIGDGEAARRCSNRMLSLNPKCKWAKESLAQESALLEHN